MPAWVFWALIVRDVLIDYIRYMLILARYFLNIKVPFKVIVISILPSLISYSLLSYTPSLIGHPLLHILSSLLPSPLSYPIS